MKQTRKEKFLARFIQAKSGCWDWIGRITVYGYGEFRPGSELHRAHRFSYQLFKGDIPKGMVIDHLCRNRRCVNPEHLEAVTQKENLARSPITQSKINSSKTHCKHGHKFDKNNTYVYHTNGRIERRCMKCIVIRSRV